MTEAEWLTSTDPARMSEFLQTRASQRKQRLVVVACCCGLVPPATRAGDDLAEQFADGKIHLGDIMIANVKRGLNKLAAMFVSTRQALPARPAASSSIEVATLPELCRDVLGNPFRPAQFDPAWRTSAVLALARQMYDSRDFSLMPVLGDALEDSGCAEESVLSHCRGDGPHVRGCWVVDSLLGKEGA